MPAWPGVACAAGAVLMAAAVTVLFCTGFTVVSNFRVTGEARTPASPLTARARVCGHRSIPDPEIYMAGRIGSCARAL